MDERDLLLGRIDGKVDMLLAQQAALHTRLAEHEKAMKEDVEFLGSRVHALETFRVRLVAYATAVAALANFGWGALKNYITGS